MSANESPEMTGKKIGERIGRALTATPWLMFATILFVVLKTTGVADMSWWVVFFPLMLPIVLSLLLLAVPLSALVVVMFLNVVDRGGRGWHVTKRPSPDEEILRRARTVNGKDGDNTLH